MKEETIKYLLSEEAHAFKGWDFSYLKGRWENEKLPCNYNILFVSILMITLIF